MRDLLRRLAAPVAADVRIGAPAAAAMRIGAPAAAVVRIGALVGAVAAVAIPAAAVAAVAPRADADGPPVVASCANERLPSEILDGRVEPRALPLPTVTLAAPQTTLRLAVASDAATRELGLMCVTRLRAQSGMIFVFPDENEWEFWMKRTLAPLDMIWAAGDGTVTAVAAHVPAATLQTPDGEVARRRGRGRYVIELTAGEARADGIAVGTHLPVPALRASP